MVDVQLLANALQHGQDIVQRTFAFGPGSDSLGDDAEFSAEFPDRADSGILFLGQLFETGEFAGIELLLDDIFVPGKDEGQFDQVRLTDHLLWFLFHIGGFYFFDFWWAVMNAPEQFTFVMGDTMLGAILS